MPPPSPLPSLNVSHLAISPDLPDFVAFLAAALVAISLALLAVELRRRERDGALILVTGILALVALCLAIARPVRISAREIQIGARVLVLADASRSMALMDGKQSRADVRDRALKEFASNARDTRLSVMSFGEGAPHPWPTGAPMASTSRERQSDLSAALRTIEKSPEERPDAIVVVSDGRLTDPPETATRETLSALVSGLKVPIHSIATTRVAPADASIRAIRTAGAAVAHVPLPVHIEVGCAGDIECGDINIIARELRDDGAPAVLASGTAHLVKGVGAIDLTLTLDRAGNRIVEFAIKPPKGDTIAENNRRFVPIHVTRERIRLLHVAGRPTVDVRALRQWLKSDASIDLVTFFILRTPADDPHATQDELALIPFPVDELFSDHLPSFDAIVLQDFDALPYGLEQHLPGLARYVRSGGGLIMVGGPDSFVGGGYAGTPLADVLPVLLDKSPGAVAVDIAAFTPNWTDEGAATPVLAPFRAIIESELPTMTGANILGDLRPGAVALWTHPSHRTSSGKSMPVLAIGDIGAGRSIALGVDGAWALEYSLLGSQTGARGYGALWSGLLGWLMRDPRYESAQIEVGGCIAGAKSTLRIRTAATTESQAIVVDISRIDANAGDTPIKVEGAIEHGSALIELPPLPSGGYIAKAKLNGATTRQLFACEAGGDEWADTRPDPERLKAISEASGGVFRMASDVTRGIPLPAPTVISQERRVTAVAPPWLWGALAAIALGAHWIARRRGGLS